MPISTHDVHKAMRELGDLRYSAVSLPDALHRIVETTHSLFGVDGAGLMLIDPDQYLRNVAVSDERINALEELQVEHQEGPCVDAFDDKDVVHAADLVEERRWPSFSPAAVERGIRAVLASPIPYNQQAVGVVAVFSTGRRPWSPEGELAIIAFTDLAALLIANTMHGDERGELAAQLQQALDARVVIEQAKGALVAKDRLTPDEAFERLRSQARRERRRVADVAGELMTALQSS